MAGYGIRPALNAAGTAIADDWSANQPAFAQAMGADQRAATARSNANAAQWGSLGRGISDFLFSAKGFQPGKKAIPPAPGGIPYAPNASYNAMAGIPNSQSAAATTTATTPDPQQFNMTAPAVEVKIKSGGADGVGGSGGKGGSGGGGTTKVPQRIEQKDDYEILQDAIKAKADAMAKEQRDGVGAMRDRLGTTLQQEMGLDLTPLMALADQWTGSNLAQSYNPESIDQKKNEIAIMQKAIQDQLAGASETELAAMQNYAKGSMDLRKVQNDELNQAEQLKLDKERNAIAWAELDEKRAKAGGDIKEPEWMAGLFGHRMNDADTALKDIYSNDKLLARATNWSSIGNKLRPDFTKDTEQLRIENAERNFITAVLRKESGASISEGEYAEAEKLYFPRPGDKPDNIAQKNAARARAIEGFRLASGGAWGRFKKSKTAATAGPTRTGDVAGGDDTPLEALLAAKARRTAAATAVPNGG